MIFHAKKQSYPTLEKEITENKKQGGQGLVVFRVLSPSDGSGMPLTLFW